MKGLILKDLYSVKFQVVMGLLLCLFSKYAAPVTNFLNENDGGALLPKYCYLADFIVTGKSVDHYGRRVLVIKPYDEWEVNPAGDYLKINIVEGIGPISMLFT